MTQIFSGLNESQKKAVVNTEGPVLIVAGPGTGKTLTIVRRIAYLIHQRVQPETILALTFTNRAAREMRERTEALLGSEVSRVFIGTFHLFGLRMIIDASASLPGMGGDAGWSNFVIYNRGEQLDLLKTIAKDIGLGKIEQKGRRLSYQKLLEKISRHKNLLEDIDEGIKITYEEYQSALRKNNALDFDDLILRPIEILHDNKVLEKYRNKFRYFMVDEYQDINPAQYKLLRLLVHSRGNICAIGDSDQAIYAFRGADVGNFLNFEKDFKDTKIITLTENYRSTTIILGASNILIKNNLKRIDKEIKPMRAKGVPIKLLSLPDEKAEGEIIIREIEEKMGGTSHYQFYAREISSCPEDKRSFQCSYKFSDFAVIYRTNAQAKAIEEAFNTSGIPYQVIGEKYLLRKKEIINFLSLLKVIISPVNDLNLHRAIVMIPEDLDKVLLHRLKELKDKLPAVEFLKVACEETDFKKYCGEENFALLKGIAAQYGDMKPPEAISRCINEISLLTPADTFNPKADSVMLMTLHMAKGLEFKVVFIAGVEDGLIPYTMKKEDVNIEEERRLFYVGMTRAMDEVLLLCARNRFLYGQRLSQSPSPFLSEILEEFKEHGFVPEKIKKMHKSDQMGLF